MQKLKPLTSKAGTSFFIAVNLMIIVPIALFFVPFFISLITSLFSPEPIDYSRILGLLSVSLVMLVLPIILITIIYRTKPISISEMGFHFCGRIVDWKKVKKITIFTGNSRRFAITYIDGNQQKKVFGSLLYSDKKRTIQTLNNIAKEHKITISKLWL